MNTLFCISVFVLWVCITYIYDQYSKYHRECRDFYLENCLIRQRLQDLENSSLSKLNTTQLKNKLSDIRQDVKLSYFYTKYS